MKILKKENTKLCKNLHGKLEFETTKVMKVVQVRDENERELVATKQGSGGLTTEQNTKVAPHLISTKKLTTDLCN